MIAPRRTPADLAVNNHDITPTETLQLSASDGRVGPLIDKNNP